MNGPRHRGTTPSRASGRAARSWTCREAGGTMGRRAAVILALAALSIAGARAQQPAASSRDISGFWALTADGKKVPDARLLPRVTRAMLDLHKRRDVHALRWCNPVGVPLMMDSGTPV